VRFRFCITECGDRNWEQRAGEGGGGSATAHLQLSVVVLAEQLHEAQDGLHDGDDDAHLAFLQALVGSRCGGAVGGRLVLFGFGLAAVGREGLLGDDGGLRELLLHLLGRHRRHHVFQNSGKNKVWLLGSG